MSKPDMCRLRSQLSILRPHSGASGESGAGDATWICQESSGNTSGKRLAACAGTVEGDYTIETKPTPRAKGGSSLLPTTSILERMAAGVAQTKCLRAGTVIRTRARGVSNNFGNGYMR